MIVDLVDVLERTSEVVRAVEVPVPDRARVLVAVNRLQVELGELADRLTPRAGKNGTPVPLPPTRPAPLPKPPADPKGK